MQSALPLSYLAGCWRNHQLQHLLLSLFYSVFSMTDGAHKIHICCQPMWCPCIIVWNTGMVKCMRHAGLWRCMALPLPLASPLSIPSVTPLGCPLSFPLGCPFECPLQCPLEC